MARFHSEENKFLTFSLRRKQISHIYLTIKLMQNFEKFIQSVVTEGSMTESFSFSGNRNNERK